MSQVNAKKLLAAAVGVGAAWLIWRFLLKDRALNLLSAVGSLPATPRGARVMATGFANGQPMPLELESIGGGHYLALQAAGAYLAMERAALNQGVKLRLTESFRTVDQQKSLLARLGRYSEGGLASTAGYSPHQRGIAVDLDVGAGGQRGATGSNAAWRWLILNAHSYAFGRDPNEAWHWQWGGVGAWA